MPLLLWVLCLLPPRSARLCDISGIANGGLDREATNEELTGGVLADGIGSFAAALFGVLPNTSFSQNVGLVATTKVVNRFCIMTGAAFLILCGFCPKLSAILSVMPQSVLGGAAVIMFAMILVRSARLYNVSALTVAMV